MKSLILPFLLFVVGIVFTRRHPFKGYAEETLKNDIDAILDYLALFVNIFEQPCHIIPYQISFQL